MATALTLSNIEVEAPTREQALAQIRQVISRTLAQGEIIDLDISDTKAIVDSSYDEIFAMFKDDPNNVTEILGNDASRLNWLP